MSKVIRVLVAPLLTMGLILGSPAPSHAIVVFAAWGQLYRFESLVRRCMAALVLQEMVFIGTAEGTFQKLINWIMLGVALGTTPAVIGDLPALSKEEGLRFFENSSDRELFNRKLPQINAAIDLLVSEVSQVMDRDGDIAPHEVSRLWRFQAEQYGLTEHDLELLRTVIIKRSNEADLKVQADKP